MCSSSCRQDDSSCTHFRKGGACIRLLKQYLAGTTRQPRWVGEWSLDCMQAMPGSSAESRCVSKKGLPTSLPGVHKCTCARCVPEGDTTGVGMGKVLCRGFASWSGSSAAGTVSHQATEICLRILSCKPRHHS